MGFGVCAAACVLPTRSVTSNRPAVRVGRDNTSSTGSLVQVRRLSLTLYLSPPSSVVPHISHEYAVVLTRMLCAVFTHVQHYDKHPLYCCNCSCTCPAYLVCPSTMTRWCLKSGTFRGRSVELRPVVGGELWMLEQTRGTGSQAGRLMCVKCACTQQHPETLPTSAPPDAVVQMW